MRVAWPQYDSVRQQSRLLPLIGTKGQFQALELAMLIFSGFLAAASVAYIDLDLRIPGNAIIRAMFPLAFGLAAAPRKGAGCVMGASAIVSATMFRWGGTSIGFGATTSLFVAGPMLDAALFVTKQGKRIYIGLALAGLATNLLAFLVRGGIKYFGADHATGRLLAFWAPQAVVTYTLCGLAAGLFSAGVWFKFRPKQTDRR